MTLDVTRFTITDRPLEDLGAPLRRSPIHERVLVVERPDGFEWVLTVWEDPGGDRALHTGVRRLVEATLLSALSCPASHREAVEQTPRALRLIQLADVPGRADAALRAFGFQPWEAPASWLEERLAALRTEARAVGAPLGDVRATWSAEIREPSGMLGDKLRALHTVMTDRLGADVWGATPGGPSRLLAELLRRFFAAEITPTLDGLRTAEVLLVQQGPGFVRWIPPLLFQALCDLVGVVTVATWGEPVQWAVCAPEPGGFVPPPTFRIDSPSWASHVPIAAHLLRWCVMPLQPGEQPPPLADWIAKQYA